MFRKNQKAFTIIEVILFIAISGLVLLIGFMGIGSRTQSVQYKDSIRQIESTVSKAFSGITSGVRSAPTSGRSCSASQVAVNPSLPDDPGTSSCVNMGVVVQFVDNGDTDLINVHQITGRHLWSGNGLNAIDGDINQIEASNPTINTVDVSTTQIPWATNVVSSTYEMSGTSSTNITAFGLVRSPGSSAIYPVVVRQDFGVSRLLFTGNPATEALVGQNATVKYCFEGRNGLFASLNFGGNFSNAVNIDDDDPSC